MKKVVVITDGEDLRAFRLNCHRGRSGLKFDTEEIEVIFHGSKPHSSRMLEDAVFGQRGASAEAVGRSREGTSEEEFHVAAQPDDKEVQSIARRISRIVREERPEIWNLVAPPEVASEIRDRLDMEVKDRLTCVRMEDLLQITAEQVEQHFNPMGSYVGANVN